ncbi:MAG: hypothetical protein J7L88_06185 [Thermoplasmata archaeon]|nr:hypothetical protein [Thermoplasmata archaeon]
MRYYALLLSILLTATLSWTVSSETSTTLQEISHSTSGWFSDRNVTIFDVLYPVDSVPLIPQFQVITNGSRSPWMEANLTRNGYVVNLTAHLILNEGQYALYQFRLLMNGEVIYTSPQRGVGLDSTPPEIEDVEMSWGGSTYGLPPIRLNADFGPSGPWPKVEFEIKGENWTSTGSATLFLHEGEYIVAGYNYTSPPGDGNAIVTLILTDGAGNRAETSFRGNFTGGRDEIRCIWPKGEMLKETLLERNFTVSTTNPLAGAQVYLFDFGRNLTYILSVGANPSENNTYVLTSNGLSEWLGGISPGRYMWQVAVVEKAIFSSPCYFTVIGTLKTLKLGLDKNIHGSTEVPLSLNCPGKEKLLLDLGFIEAVIRDPSGRDIGRANLSILPGPSIYIPANPHPFPIYYVFSSGERLRVEPERWNTSFELLPAHFPILILRDEVGGIDISTIRVNHERSNASISLDEGLNVLEMGEIASGIDAPTLVKVSLQGILAPTNISVCYRDLLPQPEEHRIFIKGEDLPPPPHVTAQRDGDLIVLRVVCNGYGVLEATAVNLFKMVDNEAVPPSEEVLINMSNEIRIYSRERMDVLVEIVVGDDRYYWRGEIGPLPWPEPELMWKVEGDSVRLWIANIPPGANNITWFIGENSVDGRSIVLRKEEVRGKLVEAHIHNVSGAVMILKDRIVVPEEREKGWSLYPPLIMDLILLAILLLLLLYPLIRRLIPVEMEIERGGAWETRRRGPIGKVTEGYTCAICLNTIQPGAEYVKCTCGARFHRKCAIRVGVCPRCGREIMVEDSFF